jgi:hypothetical protein
MHMKNALTYCAFVLPGLALGFVNIPLGFFATYIGYEIAASVIDG